ncbi:hypothetical protein BY458DRAFT_513011 [Sporodiniella umbellata]|nr:hypothetical protein BY458DRAFT_513011 [Sporodiniella umbellata]
MTKMILGSSSGGNPLNVLPTSISKMESLKHLEVAGCELTQIQPGTFGCSLEFLNLERNQIVQFDANVFTSECSNLKTLILSSNCIVELCESLPLSVPNLKALHIDNNSIHKLPNTIVIWKEMQELTLGSYVGGNPIVTLPSSIQKLKSLVCLKAINCQIECLKPDTFCPSLERLDLNRNKIAHIEPNSFNSALKFIDLSFNEIKHLGPNTFTSSLKFLVLNDNQLKCIESSVFDSLPSMLKALNLSNNAIKEIPEDLPMSLPSLKYLDIDQNNIKALPKTLGTWKKMKELILGSEDGGNPIGTIPTTIREMESLRDLNLRSCEISHLEPNTFGPSIETLDLSYNRLQELKADPFAECHNLKFMCFRENSIDYISEGFIKRIEELSKLQLDFIGLCNNKICAFPLELLSVSTVEFSIEGNPSVRPEDGWETETSEHRYQETAEGILHRSIPNTETYSKLFELSEDKTLQKLNVYTSGDDPVDTYLRIIYLAKEDPQQKTPLTLKNFGRRVTSLSEIAFKVLPIEKIQPDFPLHLQETMRQKKKCFVCKKGFFNEWLVFIHWESYASNLVLSKARVCSYECHSKCLQFLERYPFELENYVENSDDSSTEYEEVDSDMVDSEFEYEDELW